MKSLILMRHADAAIVDKSNWHNISDHSRKLTEQGRIDALKAKEFISQYQVNEILVSNALRTIETAEIIFENNKNFKILEELYTISVESICSLVEFYSDDIDKLMIIGHNPTISEMINNLVHKNDIDFLLSGLPTCGIVVIDFKSFNWSTIYKASAKISKVFSPNA